jgi:hypothetical protein
VILTLLSILFALTCCSNEPSAEEILNEFIYAYGMEGTVYSPSKESFEEGNISKELIEKIYVFDGEFPKNFAICLNSHSHKGSEVGVFVCSDENERAATVEMCLERMRLVAKNKEDAVLVRSGRIIAYSTLEEPKRAEELLMKIISRLS